MIYNIIFIEEILYNIIFMDEILYNIKHKEKEIFDINETIIIYELKLKEYKDKLIQYNKDLDILTKQKEDYITKCILIEKAKQDEIQRMNNELKLMYNMDLETQLFISDEKYIKSIKSIYGDQFIIHDDKYTQQLFMYDKNSGNLGHIYDDNILNGKYYIINIFGDIEYYSRMYTGHDYISLNERLKDPKYKNFLSFYDDKTGKRKKIIKKHKFEYFMKKCSNKIYFLITGNTSPQYIYGTYLHNNNLKNIRELIHSLYNKDIKRKHNILGLICYLDPNIPFIYDDIIKLFTDYEIYTITYKISKIILYADLITGGRNQYPINNYSIYLYDIYGNKYYYENIVGSICTYLAFNPNPYIVPSPSLINTYKNTNFIKIGIYNIILSEKKLNYISKKNILIDDYKDYKIKIYNKFYNLFIYYKYELITIYTTIQQIDFNKYILNSKYIKTYNCIRYDNYGYLGRDYIRTVSLTIQRIIDTEKCPESEWARSIIRKFNLNIKKDTILNIKYIWNNIRPKLYKILKKYIIKTYEDIYRYICLNSCNIYWEEHNNNRNNRGYKSDIKSIDYYIQLHKEIDIINIIFKLYCFIYIFNKNTLFSIVDNKILNDELILIILKKITNYIYINKVFIL